MRQIRKILAALLVMALCLSALAALADGTVRTTGEVNMRKGPGREYKSMRTISEGTKLEYDKTKKDERGVKWYRITYKGKTGWVSSMYATEKGSSSSGSSDSKVKTTGNVKLRSGPGRDYMELDCISSGKTLSYDKTEKDERGVAWYHVSYRGEKGWISSKYAKKK